MRNRLLPLGLLLLVGACDSPTGLPKGASVRPDPSVARADAGTHYLPGLESLKTVSFGGAELTFWPFTGEIPSRFHPADPMNMLFVGANDPRAIRAALLFLDGVRPGIPFDCVWTDAIGGVQTAYTEPGGWTANVVQIQCGAYGPLRFHLRLWDREAWTLGGAHLEVLIPGTTDHEILNWELPEQLVTFDLTRAGALNAPPAVSEPIFPSPYRNMRRPVYDALPEQLLPLIAGWPGVVPAMGNVPLLTDTRATMLSLASVPGSERVVARQQFTLEFDQVIPRPYCEPAPIYVTGPVRLAQIVVFTPSGNLLSTFHAVGHLQVAPIDPQTGAPGEPYRALVNQRAKGIITDATTLVTRFEMFAELPRNKPGHGTLVVRMSVGPKGAVSFDSAMECN